MELTDSNLTRRSAKTIIVIFRHKKSRLLSCGPGTRAEDDVGRPVDEHFRRRVPQEYVVFHDHAFCTAHRHAVVAATYARTHSQSDRQSVRQTDSQTDRQTDR